MALINFDITILPAKLNMMWSKLGGHWTFSHTIGVSNVGSYAKVTMMIADTNKIVALTRTDANGNFDIRNLAKIKYVIIAQDLSITKRARATTLDLTNV